MQTGVSQNKFVNLTMGSKCW